MSRSNSLFGRRNPKRLQRVRSHGDNVSVNTVSTDYRQLRGSESSTDLSSPGVNNQSVVNAQETPLDLRVQDRSQSASCSMNLNFGIARLLNMPSIDADRAKELISLHRTHSVASSQLEAAIDLLHFNDESAKLSASVPEIVSQSAGKQLYRVLWIR